MPILISPSERDYILRGVDANIRADGRGRLDYRQITFETGLISQCSGSARCRVGEESDVLVGIKVEIGQIEMDGTEGDEKGNRGRVVCNVECSPIASQQFAGRGAEDTNNELTQILDRVFNGPQGGIDLEKLCIIPGEQCWIVYIDALVLDYGGNILDTIFLTIRAALYNTRIPKVEVPDGTLEIEISDDVEEAERIVGWDKVPISVTLSKIGTRHIIDATPLEEFSTEVKLLVTVNIDGKLCGIQKSGEGSIEPSLLNEMIQTGRTIGQKMLKSLDMALLREENEMNAKIAKGEQIEKLGFFAAIQ